MDDNNPSSNSDTPEQPIETTEQSLPKERKDGGRRITAELYAKLIEAFRARPGEVAKAARQVGIQRMTADRAWKIGWPKRGWRPIRDIIKQEHVLARAMMHDSEETAKARAEAIIAEANEKLALANSFFEKKMAESDEATRQMYSAAEVAYKERVAQAEQAAKQKLAELLDKARMDAAETLAHEAQISRSARGTALAVYAVGSHIFSAKNIPKIVQIMNDALTAKNLTPKEAAMLLRTFGRFAIDVNQSAKLALDIERERLGQPTEHVQLDVNTMTMDEAIKELKEASALAELLIEEKQAGEIIDEIPSPESGSNGSVH